MFGDVWEWGGQTRKFDTNFGVPWIHVEQRLFNLFDDLKYWESSGSMPLLEQAVRLHHQAVLIHPFANGNGRWSRMLANIWLKQRDHPITEWPAETSGTGTESVIRAEYLIAIREADNGKIDRLLELHRQFTPPPKK